MEIFVSYLLAGSAILIAVPIALLFIEVFSAVVLPRREEPLNAGHDHRHSVAVLVPAHNESIGLCPTLDDIKSQLQPGDRAIVVADNCTDDTAAVAASKRIEVVERHDLGRIGKGYALEFGLGHLGLNPPDIVVIIDADCRLADGTIDRLALMCAQTGRPVQALDLMVAPSRDQPGLHGVAEFAWRLKNWIRPLGLSKLGLPCQLMGTGMAFPWSVLRSAELASGLLVEDLKLGLDLAMAGKPALFCPTAVVTSTFPTSSSGSDAQRKRWEQGHLSMIVTSALPLVAKGLFQGNFGLVALALDMAIPPLSLLAMFVCGICLTGGLAAMFGFSSIAFTIGLGSLLAFSFAIVLSWLGFGREVLPARAILSTFHYFLGKLRIYHELLSGRTVGRWTRTDRNNFD